MTTLVWLAGASLVWGAMVWGAAVALQSGNDLSGQARQWTWRVAALLLIAPWIAAPFAGLLADQMVLSAVPEAGAGAGQPVASGPAPTPVTELAYGEDLVAAPTPVDLPWIEILAGMIVVGWLVRMAMAFLAAMHLRALVRKGCPVADGPAHTALLRWSNRLGLRKPPELRKVSTSLSPFSTGAVRPIICVPQGLEQKLAPDALELVIGHESIHVARGDGWLRPVERAIADLLWFNPCAWAIRRELDLARELACDEAVVKLSAARRAYARALRDVASLAPVLSRSAPAASMSISGGGRIVAMRMKRTLDAAKLRPGKAVLVGGALLALAGAPMAIAQAVLIEAAQPPQAPSAPPAEPLPPSTRAWALAPKPPTPLRTPDHVFTSGDGLIRLSFPAKVMSTGGSAGQGYEVELLQTPRGAGEEICSARLSGLSNLRVAKDQVIAKGDVVGSESDTMSFAITCSDEIDASGRPVAGHPSAPPPPIASSAHTTLLPVPPVPAAPTLPAPSAAAPPAPAAPATPATAPRPSSRLLEDRIQYQENQLPPPSGFEALYDTDNLITLRGRIVKVEWSAPRSRLHLQEEGTDRRWEVMGGSPYDLTSEQRASVQIGTEVIVRAYQTRDKRCDPACLAFGRDFQRANGSPLVTPPLRSLAPAPPTAPITAAEPIHFAPQASHPVLTGPAKRISGFGIRTDPFTKENSFHGGVDIATAKGASVHTPGPGVVTFAGIRGDDGRVVEVKLDENYKVRFGHLDEIAVALGEAVDAGGVIGTVGSTGRSTGPHLHLEVYRDGKSYDPETVEGLRLIGPG